MHYENPEGLCAPLGLYSHISVSDDGRVVSVAGQVGMDLDGNLAGDDMAAQLEQVVKNLAAALEAAGASLADIASMTSYLIDADDIARFYEARAEIFPRHFGGQPYPPNTLLVVQRLVDPRLRVEVQALAVRAAQ